MAGILKCPKKPGGVKCPTTAGWTTFRQYQQARTCGAGGAKVDVWMTAADAKRYPHFFSLNYPNTATKITDGPYAGDLITCPCLWFDWSTKCGEQPGTLYTPDMVTSQPTADNPPADSYPFGQCSCCGTDAAHRVLCRTYIFAFHLKLEVWAHGNSDTYPFDPIPDPAACGAPSPCTVEADFSILLTRPSLFSDCVPANFEHYQLSVCGFTMYWDVATAWADCGSADDPSDAADGVGVYGYLATPDGSNPGFGAGTSRARHADISGAYPGVTSCGLVDGYENCARYTMTGVTLTCADGI